jgi:extracellular elastinolytic metalloproteinase
MRVHSRVVLACALVGMLASAPTAVAADPTAPTGLPDLDVRSGTIAPTAAQRADARALGGQVAWNQFGTPSSLVDPGGTLATHVAGASATDAARSFMSANRSLFRLSTTRGLELVSDNKLAGIDAHAVTLRQAPGGVNATGGGLVTVGLAKSAGAWKVLSVSSSLSGDETLAAGSRLNLAQGWQRAAASVGRSTSLARVTRVRANKSGLAKGWTGLHVAGLSDLQQARKVAFPTPSRGYVPAYETLVINSAGATPSAYHVVVDAATGRTLERDNLVESAAQGAAAAPTTTTPFSGELPAEDGSCDTRKGPFTVAADDGVRAIDVFANADSNLNDIVLKLFQGATEVAEADTLRTPERIRFAPDGGVPAGDYFVQVCEFGDGVPPVEPRTYTGTITLDTSAPPAPFLARWRAFPANPPLAALQADPWNHPNTDTRQNWCWNASTNPADCDKVIGNLASRSPWDFSPKANAPTNTTAGNNARSAESWTDPIQPAPNQFMPTSPTRDYSFPWTNAWANADCDPGNPYGTAFVVGQSFDVSAAATNLFAMHNRMHDFSYLLGFTEQNFNAQESNFGLTEAFRENDPVVGDVQAGAAIPPPDVYGVARDNANMITLPDGSSSVTNMYLWQPIAGAFYAPCVDGDYDMGVIGHEFTHMIENRTVGKGANRAGFQAGAMGEAVGDLFAVEYLHESGFVPTGDENDFAEGAYATGNKVRGIRNYAMNFPSTGAFPTPGQQTNIDPLNFSDVGYDLTGPEVHADGEIWIAINFDVRQALIEKYNAQFPATDQELQEQCEAGQVPVAQCPGNRRWIQLLFDAFLLMRTDPSMIDARNAMLAADQARFGGADVPEITLAFARRGMGRFASQTNGSGRVAGVESDTNPLPDFEAAGQNNARINFTARSTGGGDAPKARIYVGHYEARVSPIADTDPATNAPTTASANNLDSTAVFAPGTYEFIATAPGFGAVRFRQTFRAGGNRTIDIRFAPNLASTTAGATATGDATAVTSPTGVPAPGEPSPVVIQPTDQVLKNLIDDSESSDWQVAADQQPDGSFGVDGKQVTIDLAGTKAQTIRHVQVSSMLGIVFDKNARPRPTDLTQNRFTAVRQFEIWTCNDQVADCSTDAGFQRAFQSGTDAFPANAPRPVAPHLLLRDFTFSPVKATHVRVVVRSTQCTGGPDFQGEQDADPFNDTDCNSAGPASTRFARLAEVQVFDGTSRAG